MKLCKICHKRKATRPDRDSGSSRREVCGECHAELLKADFINVLTTERKRKEERRKE